MNHLLSMDNIKMHFYARTGLWRSVVIRALDDVSLHLDRGEIVALVGESGSGKTTLGRVSLRLLKPTAGRVIFQGADITSVAESRLKWFRQRAQPVVQDPFSSLDPYMTIGQVLEEPLLIHGLGKRRELVHQALEEVKLAPAQDFTTTYPHMLSGGQQQRVAIARALILGPQYVLADEPVSMIDASSRAEILYLLRDLQKRHGMTILYITHDIATARHFSHRIAVMYLGKIVEQGNTDEVVGRPLHPYTRGLIEAIPEPDPNNRFRERSAIQGEPPSPAAVPPGCGFHPRCPFFMRATCDVATPPLREIQPGHYTACHLY